MLHLQLYKHSIFLMKLHERFHFNGADLLLLITDSSTPADQHTQILSVKYDINECHPKAWHFAFLWNLSSQILTVHIFKFPQQQGAKL